MEDPIQYPKRGAHFSTIQNLLRIDGSSVPLVSKPHHRPDLLIGVPEYKGRNHIQANIKRMRQIQKTCRLKQKEQEGSQPTPVKALWKSEKYSNIPSRVKSALETEPLPPRPSSANFLRAHSRCGAVDRPASARSNNARCMTPTYKKPSIPMQRSSSALELDCKDVDFIRINGRNAKFSKVERSPSEIFLRDTEKKKEGKLNAYKRGEVPKYLRDRQKQWQDNEEERIRNMPDPDQPEGHRRLPDDERKRTLEALQEKYKQVQSELERLPLRSDTLRIRTIRNDLESKLAEIEEAVKVFSRSKVFVRC